MQGDPMDKFAQREMDDAIVDALGDTPRAADLSRMKEILIRHRDVLQHEFDTEERPEEKQKLESRLDEIDQQIQSMQRNLASLELQYHCLIREHEQRSTILKRPLP